MRSKRLLAGTLAATTAMTMGATSIFAFSDTTGHWGQDAINEWTGYNVISGYPGGNFGPNDEMTRGQFAIILSHVMKYPNKAALDAITDVDGSEYYAEAIAELVGYGVMSGYGDGKIGPNDSISREQAVTMLCKAFVLAANGNTTTFKDDALISDWAKTFVVAAQEAGLVNGDEKGNFNPKANLTRAEGIAMINNIIDKYIYEPGEVDLTGVTGLVLVNCDGVTLKNGNNVVVVAAAGIDDGTVTINDSTVEGILSLGAKNIALTGTTEVSNVIIGYEAAKITTSDSAKVDVDNVIDTVGGSIVDGVVVGLEEKAQTAKLRSNGSNAYTGDENFDYATTYKNVGVTMMDMNANGEYNVYVNSDILKTQNTELMKIVNSTHEDTAFLGFEMEAPANAAKVRFAGSSEGLENATDIELNKDGSMVVDGKFTAYLDLAKKTGENWAVTPTSETDVTYIEWRDADGTLIGKNVLKINVIETTSLDATIRGAGPNAECKEESEIWGNATNFNYEAAYTAAGIKLTKENNTLKLTVPATLTAENEAALAALFGNVEQGATPEVAYVGLNCGKVEGATKVKASKTLAGLEDAVATPANAHEGNYMQYIGVASRSADEWAPITGSGTIYLAWMDDNGKVIKVTSTNYSTAVENVDAE